MHGATIKIASVSIEKKLHISAQEKLVSALQSCAVEKRLLWVSTTNTESSSGLDHHHNLRKFSGSHKKCCITDGLLSFYTV